MAAIEPQARSHAAAKPNTWRTALYIFLLTGFIAAGAFIIAFDVFAPNESTVALEVGGVAPRDILAPRSLRYDSDVLTQARRDAEDAAVRPIYDPPDHNLMRAQVHVARCIRDLIRNARSEYFATSS